MARYECKLSPEALKKAADELNEPMDNALRLAEIDKLRNRFKEESDGHELMRSDDAFLLRFLRVRKFDQDRALASMIHYHSFRDGWKELYDLIENPKLMEDILDHGPALPLAERAKNGTFIVVARPGLGIVESADLLKFFATMLLTLETLLENEEFQIYGLTLVQDLSHFGLSLVIPMATYGRRLFSFIQEAQPVRVKSVNMFNEALVFDAVYAIISRFMKDKLKSRLQVCGTDFSKLYEIIDRKHLPFFLGGDGSDLNPASWKEKLMCTKGTGEATSL